MEKQFVTYDIAKLMKGLGYNEQCMAYYAYTTKIFYFTNLGTGGMSNSELMQSTAAPLWQQAIDWLREKYKLRVDIILDGGISEETSWSGAVYDEKRTYWSEVNPSNRSTYYKARESAILKSLELIKNN